MRPCDCKDEQDTKKLQEIGISHNDESIVVNPNHVTIRLGCTQVTLSMFRFRQFAEWYLEDQPETEPHTINSEFEGWLNEWLQANELERRSFYHGEIGYMREGFKGCLDQMRQKNPNILKEVTTAGWEVTKGEREVTCHTKMIGGVLCRWWGDGPEPEGVGQLNELGKEKKTEKPAGLLTTPEIVMRRRVEKITDLAHQLYDLHDITVGRFEELVKSEIEEAVKEEQQRTWKK